ncbi:MAG: tetratricopeptide repeat protein [Polyangiaceae bacterium]
MTPAPAAPIAGAAPPVVAVEAQPAAPEPTAAQPAQAPKATEAKPADAGKPTDDVGVADEVAVSFFSAPPVTQPSYPVDETAAADAASERRRRLGSETVVARRRDFARYVTGAVAVCFMICAAAAVRAATVSHSDREEASLPRSHAGVVVPPPPVAEVTAPAAPADTTPTPIATETPTETATATAAGEPSPSAPPGDAVDPRASKKLAQRALDRGDATKAIEAAKQSVESDPGDAETWLILGGAYLQRGAAREARESFASCSRMATRGPRSECRALLR